MDKLDTDLYIMTTMGLGITFMHCNFIPVCRARIDKVYKGYVSVQLMESGTVSLSYDDETYTLNGAWVWAAWPGPRIRFHPVPERGFWRHRYVAFRGPKALELAERGLFPYAPVPVPNPVGDTKIFDELLGYASRVDPIGRELALQHLELFLNRLRDDFKGLRNSDRIEHEVRFRLLQSGEDAPDYARIAADLGMAESTLRRRFFKATGKSMHSFFIEERIGEARTLLANSDLSVKEVSERLGYNDVYYFTRQFKKHVGTPPSAFRKSIQT